MLPRSWRNTPSEVKRPIELDTHRPRHGGDRFQDSGCSLQQFADCSSSPLVAQTACLPEDMAEAFRNAGAGAFRDLPDASQAEHFGTVVNAEFGRLVANSRKHVNLIDAAPARQLTDEAPDARVGLVRRVRKKDREIQTKSICFRGRHELLCFHVSDMATMPRATIGPTARSGVHP